MAEVAEEVVDSSGTVEPTASDDDPKHVGTIPCRIRIGVTGHQDLAPDPRLEELLRGQIRRVHGLWGPARSKLRLAVVSQLAEGADRLVVRHVLAEGDACGAKAHLEVVLPVASKTYPELQDFSDESRDEFEHYLDLATDCAEPGDVDLSTPEAREAAYESASRQLIVRCDVLIAIWDGGPTGGRGGTAETLLAAAAVSTPCIWIPTGSSSTVQDNLEPGSSDRFYREVRDRVAASLPSGPKTYRRLEWRLEPLNDVLEPLNDVFRMMDRYNHEHVPHDFGDRVELSLESEGSTAEWMAPPLSRARLLAARWRRRFAWAARLIALFSLIAAFGLAVSLTKLIPDGEAWILVEIAGWASALLAVGIVRGLRFRHRWLSYRVLAERLKAAYYLAGTGFDFRRQARLGGAYVGEHSEDWIMRAVEEVWDRRPRTDLHLRPVRDEVESLRDRLADEWVGSQIKYHQAAAADHQRRHRQVARIIVLAFCLTLFAAVGHALGFHPSKYWTFATIILPAFGASLGLLLTVQQHQAVGERHSQVAVDLLYAQRALLDANATTLRHATTEAARVIEQDAGTWVGAMWFLDIEHP
jgi:hypothetical protein